MSDGSAAIESESLGINGSMSEFWPYLPTYARKGKAPRMLPKNEDLRQTLASRTMRQAPLSARISSTGFVIVEKQSIACSSASSNAFSMQSARVPLPTTHTLPSGSREPCAFSAASTSACPVAASYTEGEREREERRGLEQRGDSRGLDRQRSRPNGWEPGRASLVDPFPRHD